MAQIRQDITPHDRIETKIVRITGECSLEYYVSRNAHLTLVLLLHAAKELQADVCVRMAEVGSQADIVGFIVGTSESRYVLNTQQLHESAETRSNLLVRSVLYGSDAFFYRGSIRVDVGAQKTDAYQRNENLLLSPNAHTESKPMLEILANDVRCTHGATVSSIPKEELWYLESRGIPKHSGKKLITDGFLERSLALISDTIARQEVRKWLHKAM